MRKHNITIEYCTQCLWMFRAVWMGQELLTTFSDEISEFTLKPGTGGVYNIFVNDQLIFSRKEKNRFPEITELKKLVRDIVAPVKNLGHSEK